MSDADALKLEHLKQALIQIEIWMNDGYQLVLVPLGKKKPLVPLRPEQYNDAMNGLCMHIGGRLARRRIGKLPGAWAIQHLSDALNWKQPILAHPPAQENLVKGIYQ